MWTIFIRVQLMPMEYQKCRSTQQQRARVSPIHEEEQKKLLRMTSFDRDMKLYEDSARRPLSIDETLVIENTQISTIFRGFPSK